MMTSSPGLGTRCFQEHAARLVLRGRSCARHARHPRHPRHPLKGSTNPRAFRFSARVFKAAAAGKQRETLFAEPWAPWLLHSCDSSMLAGLHPAQLTRRAASVLTFQVFPSLLTSFQHGFSPAPPVAWENFSRILQIPTQEPRYAGLYTFPLQSLIKFHAQLLEARMKPESFPGKPFLSLFWYFSMTDKPFFLTSSKKS